MYIKAAASVTHSMKYVEEHTFFCGMPKQRRNAASLCLVHEMLGLYMQPASVDHHHYKSTLNIAFRVTDFNFLA